MNTVERLLQFIDYKDISKREFYIKTSLANGTLDRPKSIGSESLSKIHAAYPELNMLWVLYGEGDMVAVETKIETPRTESLSNQVLEEMRAINEKVSEQAQKAGEQAQLFFQEIQFLKSQLQEKDITIHELTAILGKR